MANQVVAGALCQCSFGAAPSALGVLPSNMTNAVGPATATTAAQGVLTPMPCIPVTSAPWVPGSPTVMIGGLPALNDSSQLMCSWAGVISINFAGQVTVQIP